jgi:hypothetical protein
MSLSFTTSRDGARRATVRLDHRVGLEQLATAAALALDEGYLEGEDLDARAARLTRRDIERELRDRLQAGGDDGFLFVGERSFMGYELFDETVAGACRARVLALWPELTPTEETT